MKIEELVKSIDLLQSDIKRRKPTEIDFFWSQHCAIKKNLWRMREISYGLSKIQ